MTESSKGHRMRSVVRGVSAAVLAGVLIGGCTSAPEPTSAEQPAAPAELGAFPAYPAGALPRDTATKLQEVLDGAVDDGSVRGLTAAVVGVGSGSWSGAAGFDTAHDTLSAHSMLPTASVGKTVTAAEVLYLVERGRLRLDDRAAEHLPPELARFDVNGATIRDLLGMRSGFTDPPDYVALDEDGDIVPLVEALEPSSPPAVHVEYANVNYDILGAIVEHVTKSRLPAAVRSGVLAPPQLEGFEYRVEPGRTVHDGHLWTDAATLARWGYDLYGGFVLNDGSLRAMTAFRGEFYGLGAIDFTHPGAEAGYDGPAVGHGGIGESHVVRLVAFPDAGVVVSVLANADDFEQVRSLVESLRDAAG